MNARNTSRRRPRGERDILLTGFPSFLARRLAEVILREEPDSFLRLLVRPDFVERAAEQLDSMGANPDRYQLLSGDVVALDLGLSGTEYLELLANVTDIYHIASIWYLGADKRELHQVNVEGARNVIDAAMEMEHLNRLNHYSTAFVAGRRAGVIMEDELEEGQTFRNPYEHTKYQAEVAMRAAMKHIPISVFRPSIVVGDSRSGEIDRMAGPYFLMNLIVQMPEAFPILMPGKGDKPLNMVPVDFVCEAIHRISRQPGSAGKTFHLSDPNPFSARMVFQIVAEAADKRPPVGHIPYSLTKWVMKLPYLEKFTRSPRQFAEDFNHLTIYNSINTVEALGGELQCPPFTTYAQSLVDYIRATGLAFDIDLSAMSNMMG